MLRIEKWLVAHGWRKFRYTDRYDIPRYDKTVDGIRYELYIVLGSYFGGPSSWSVVPHVKNFWLGQDHEANAEEGIRCVTGCFEISKQLREIENPFEWEEDDAEPAKPDRT